MPENITERSEEIQDIIGQIPPWITRKGIGVILVIFIAFLWLSWFIKYPDIVKGSTIITTSVSPVELICKESGILKLLIRDKVYVKKEEIIGYIEGSGRVEDLLYLERNLTASNDTLNENLKLGELQPLFSNWKLTKRKLENSRWILPYHKEIKYLNEQIRDLKALNKNLNESLEIYREELSLINERFLADSILFTQQVISSVAFKESRIFVLRHKRKLKNQKSDILNNEYRIKDLRKQINLLKIQSSNDESILKQEFSNVTEELRNSILKWKQKFLFAAPFDGELTYLDFLQDNHFAYSGEALFAVLPKESNFQARVTVPAYASGKVKVGQKANIKLDNFPNNEFGMLKGVVSNVSTIPGMDPKRDQYIYTVMVDLPDGLKTTYNKDLPFGQYLTGQMDIVTNDRRVLERIFGWARSLYQKSTY